MKKYILHSALFLGIFIMAVLCVALLFRKEFVLFLFFLLSEGLRNTPELLQKSSKKHFQKCLPSIKTGIAIIWMTFKKMVWSFHAVAGFWAR